MSNVRTSEPGQPPLTIEPQPGGTLDPSKVVGREGLIDEALSLLRGGTNLLITDPRRMGKTSFLARLAWTVRDPEHAVVVDFEGVDTVDEFLRRLVAGLRDEAGVWNRAKKAFTGLFENLDIGVGPVKVSAAFASRSSSSILEESIRELGAILAKDGQMLVLLLDEVPIAVHNIAKREGPEAADVLLQTLRRLRQRHGSGIRWVLTGSIGFHHVLRVVGSTEGVVGDLHALSCGALDDGGARTLSAALLRGVKQHPTDESVRALIDRSGGIPFLMHQLAHRLRLARLVDASTVAEVFETFIEDRDASKPFTHLLSRIETFYGEDAPIANRLLDRLGREPLDFDAICTELSDVDREHLRQVIDLLVDDHYLMRRGNQVSWRYPILQEIWVRRRR